MRACFGKYDVEKCPSEGCEVLDRCLSATLAALLRSSYEDWDDEAAWSAAILKLRCGGE